MRFALVMLLIVAVAGSAVAADLGKVRVVPGKTPSSTIYVPPSDAPRQGGDGIGQATVISSIPYSATGTTDGYTDRYDETCPYSGSTSPDVVYSYTPTMDVYIAVDLCGSSYDTKTYVYDADQNAIACNDDYYYDDTCGSYVSFAEAFLYSGETYYIIIDGYGGAYGDYVLNVYESDFCPVNCPSEGVAEGEPALYDGYEDTYNTGCNDDYGIYPFQAIDWTNDEDGLPPYDGSAWLCGVTGWYIAADGESEYRDTDWFVLNALEDGTMEVTLEAMFPTTMYHLIGDCSDIDGDLELNLAYPDCVGTMSIPVTAGEEVWLWVGPTDYTGPVQEYPYFLSVTNNEYESVSNEDMSWGDLKSLYQ